MSELDIKTVLDDHVEKLMSNDGVVGVAIGEAEDQTPCILVLVIEKSENLCQKLPKTIEGYPVLIEESGKFKSM